MRRAGRVRRPRSEEYERGIAEAERIRELNPELVDPDIGNLYLLLGRPEDYVSEFLAFFSRGGAALDPEREAFQRGSEERGWQGGLRAWRRLEIEQATQGAFGLNYPIAFLSAMIGETEEAMTWLERAYEERDPLLLLANVEPLLPPPLRPPLPGPAATHRVPGELETLRSTLICSACQHENPSEAKSCLLYISAHICVRGRMSV